MPRKMDSRSNILQLCRLCLVKEQVNIDIFNEHGEERQISEKISSCLPVKVSQNDKLPKRICDGCSYKLDMCYEFCNLTVKAEQQLLTWLEDLPTTEKSNDVQNNVAPNNAKPTEAIVKEEQIDPSDVHKEEDDKDYVFAEKVEENNAGPSATVTQEDEPPPKRQRRTAAVKAAIAMDHDSDDDDDSGEPLTKMEDESDDSDGEDNDPSFADIPSTSADDQPGPSGVGKEAADAPNNDDMTEHMPCKIEIKEEILEVIPQLKVCSSFLCEICDENLPSSVDFAVHSIKHSVRFYCHHCDFKTKLQDVIANHVLYHGNGSETFQCEKCSEKFPESIQASEHKHFHDDETPYSCSNCQKSFMFSWLRRTHERLCRAGRIRTNAAKCEACNLSFRTLLGLNAHNTQKHKQHDRSKYVCTICEKGFAVKGSLNRHVNVHTGLKHTCSICERFFSTETRLNIHKLLHSGDKSFKCQYCAKAFTANSQVTKHERIHTGEKPFACECRKSFTFSATLRRHRRTCHVANAAGLNYC